MPERRFRYTWSRTWDAVEPVRLCSAGVKRAEHLLAELAVGRIEICLIALSDFTTVKSTLTLLVLCAVRGASTTVSGSGPSRVAIVRTVRPRALQLGGRRRCRTLGLWRLGRRSLGVAVGLSFRLGVRIGSLHGLSFQRRLLAARGRGIRLGLLSDSTVHGLPGYPPEAGLHRKRARISTWRPSGSTPTGFGGEAARPYSVRLAGL